MAFKILFKKITLDILNKLNIDPDKLVYFINKLRFGKIDVNLQSNKKIIDAFANLFYDQGKVGQTINNTNFLGI